MRVQSFLLFVLFLSVLSDLRAEETYMYRLYMKDKGNSSFNVENPEEFLSEKSIQRRTKQGYSVDESDLPYDPSYLEAIRQTGAEIRTYSKWVNTVVVYVPALDYVTELENLSFVDSLHCVWKGTLPALPGNQHRNMPEQEKYYTDLNSYGTGFTQISINNGHLLHHLGFYGEGLSIAVIDGGFVNADKIDFFDSSRIKEVKSFNHEVTDPLVAGADHGTRVLSCMLAEKSGELIGTAPKADYYLFRTEVDGEEFPVEEDYWMAALEYADSTGVDIVTTSLGYARFDFLPEMNHTHAQLDGQTVPASKAASMAASKGLILLNSAGNEGDKDWEKIMVPGDAESIITVGGITKNLEISPFSSKGPTADGRVKPEVVAMGSGVSVVNGSGQIANANGTSFSTPIMAGLTACLWEAFPDRSNRDIMQAIRETATRRNDPDTQFGYGIADVMKAHDYLSGKPGEETVIDLISGNEYIRISPYNNYLYVNFDKTLLHPASFLSVYSGIGTRVMLVSEFTNAIDISRLPKGIYIAFLQTNGGRIVQKFVKI